MSAPTADILAVVGAFDKIMAAVAQAQTTGQPGNAVAQFAAKYPDIIAAIEKVANYFFPGAGTGIELLLLVLENARPMTQEETNAWMARQDGGQ